MLSQRLPRIFPTYRLNYGDVLESFALTYLASYNTEAIQPRVFTSYQNSYGMDNLIMIPRTPGGRPGAVIAFYAGPHAQKVVVAIEGAIESSQVIGWNRQPRSTTFSNTAGRVFTPFAEYATALLSALNANGAFTGFLNQRNTAVVFTGGSLGAAVAELCAERIKALFPQKTVKLAKFGSPRVGNARYRDNLNANIARTSYYCNNDPIHWLPSGMLHNFISGWDSLGIGLTWMVRDETIVRMNRRGEIVGGYDGSWAPAVVSHLADRFRTMNSGNPWFDHDFDVYRNMFCNANDVSDDLAKARFLGIEHNDENSWGVNWRPGEFVLPGYKVLLTPQPAAIHPPNMRQAPMLNPLNQEPALVIQDTEGLGVEGDWGPETNVRPASVMRRLTRRQ
jgi:hypothetical protein